MSASDPFDLERLRRNWERAADPEPLPLPERAKKVRAPEDVPAEATKLLEKVRRLGLAAHPEHHTTLVPFLDRAAEALATVGTSPEPDPAATEELLKALVDLEDLFDVFATTKR